MNHEDLLLKQHLIDQGSKQLVTIIGNLFIYADRKFIWYGTCLGCELKLNKNGRSCEDVTRCIWR